MRSLLQTLMLLCILTLASCSFNQEPNKISLETGWKFMKGDHPDYANPACNDSAWATINPNTIWEYQGHEGFDGIAWYRIHVVIPASLKTGSPYGDSIQFMPGKIDDCDQVFLNGALIGENGITVKAGTVAGEGFVNVRGIWDLPRRYVLSVNDPRILWDKENILAIRCYDQGGAGGLFGNNHEISIPGIRDYLSFDFSGHAFELKYDSTIIRKFTLRNKSQKKEFQGKLKIRAVEERGICLFSEQADMLIEPGITSERQISFKCDPYKPVHLILSFNETLTGATLTDTIEVPYLTTPPVKPEPSINGASIFGVRPYSPFFFKVAATGTPPLHYAAPDLPEGLSIDSVTGIITGTIKKRGEYIVTLHVGNSVGYAERDLKIVVGDLISLTPPMGWNSWNCWGLSVSDRKVRESAGAMKSSGLIDHGWTYVNIDDGWEDTHDRDGNILTNEKFPDMKALCSFVHGLGLKIGIYSSPGPKTCGGYEGSYQFEEKDARNYAAWGIDYLKYDWCSYGQIAPKPTPEQLKAPYKEMKHAIRKVNRDIHYSLCQYGMGRVWEWGAEVDGNSWRTTGDIEDTWESMSKIGFRQNKCSPYATPGRWNDPDMLVVGWVGWGPALHYTRLTPNEQYTHITLWSLLASPLLIGCDLSQLDAFTLNLLTNDEVLAVNQDPCGKQADLVRQGPGYQVWAKELENGSIAIGLFNLTGNNLYIPFEMNDLQLDGIWVLRDLWRQTELGTVRGHFEMKAPAHGARFITLTRKLKNGV